MEIILKEDIVNLGYKNDIVNVKSGYGQNLKATQYPLYQGLLQVIRGFRLHN